jgi:membrane-bound serine protease (ClpP class)
MTETALQQAGIAFGVGAAFMVALLIALALLQRRGAGDYRLGDRFGAEAATVAEWRGDRGAVYAGGELWRARAKEALAVGEAVEVVRAEGLTLVVRKARAQELKEDN